jgi:hypothetical protein
LGPSGSWRLGGGAFTGWFPGSTGTRVTNGGGGKLGGGGDGAAGGARAVAAWAARAVTSAVISAGGSVCCGPPGRRPASGSSPGGIGSERIDVALTTARSPAAMLTQAAGPAL